MQVEGRATLAREAECEGARRTGVGDGDGGVVQLPHEVGRGRGGDEGEARVRSPAEGITGSNFESPLRRDMTTRRWLGTPATTPKPRGI